MLQKGQGNASTSENHSTSLKEDLLESLCGHSTILEIGHEVRIEDRLHCFSRLQQLICKKEVAWKLIPLPSGKFYSTVTAQSFFEISHFFQIKLPCPHLGVMDYGD